MKRIKGFDGLRAIAVTCVFAAHMRPLEIPLSSVAVYVFFVLSGFLITGLLTDQRRAIEHEHAGRVSELLVFYWRRSLRIFPVYYLALGAYALWIWQTSGEGPSGLWAYVSYLTNIWLGTQESCRDVLLCHFWSLAIEEQFYVLVAPLLIFVPRRRHLGVVFAVFAIGVLSLFLAAPLGLDEREQYLLSPTNFTMLAAGGLVALLRRRPAGFGAFHPAAALLAALVVIGFIALSKPVRAQSSALFALFFLLTIAGIAIAIAWLAVHPDSRVARGLEWRPLAYLGTVSYGFYLYHPACIHAYRGLVQWPAAVTAVVPASALAAFNALACFALTFGISHLSWKLIERPILEWRNRPPAWLLKAPGRWLHGPAPSTESPPR